MKKTHLILSALFALVAMAAAAPRAMAQSIAYGVARSSYSYIDISQTGTQVLNGSDDATATLQLAFPFKFYGQTYTAVSVSSNGLMTFGGAYAEFANLDLTNQAPPPAGNLPMIAPLWCDLNFNRNGSGLFYQTLGTAPNRQFVVQWQNALYQNLTTPLNFQVILNETGGGILMQYRNLVVGSAAVDNGAAATVGLRAIDGQSNKNVKQYSYKAGVLANQMALLFTPPAGTSATDVTSSFLVTRSGLTFNRFTNTYSGTIVIKNTSAGAINLPLTVLLTGLAAPIQATNATGQFPGTATIPAGPYYNVPGSGSLAAGASATISVTFSGASGPTFTYGVKVYSGSF